MDKMSDGEMIVMLHDLARATDEEMLRNIADRFSELVKESKRHDLDGLYNRERRTKFYH